MTRQKRYCAQPLLGQFMGIDLASELELGGADPYESDVSLDRDRSEGSTQDTSSNAGSDSSYEEGD